MRYKNGNIQDHRISNLFVSDKPRAPKQSKSKTIIPSNGKLPDNIRFMERRNQYRLDIPGMPARYYPTLAEAMHAGTPILSTRVGAVMVTVLPLTVATPGLELL